MSSVRPLHWASRLALLIVSAAIWPLGIGLGQTAPGSPIVTDIPVAVGTERVLFLGTQGARALLVLLPGTDGIVGLDSEGGVHQLGGNFLVRTIGQWTAQGFDVVLPDAPNGTSLLGQRHLPAYVGAISRAIDFGRSRANLPVWLIATSQGSIAAVNGAAHLGSKVAVSPPGDAPNILAALTRSPRKELVMVTSGQIARRASPCEANSPHGYLGIETMVVQRISDWIRMAGAR